jgi:hypothetical protein
VGTSPIVLNMETGGTSPIFSGIHKRRGRFAASLLRNRETDLRCVENGFRFCEYYFGSTEGDPDDNWECADTQCLNKNNNIGCPRILKIQCVPPVSQFLFTILDLRRSFEESLDDAHEGLLIAAWVHFKRLRFS